MEPWHIEKGLSGKSEIKQLRMKSVRARTIYITAETLRNMGIMLQPFIPDKAAHLLDVLGVSENKRTCEYLGLGKDFSYGKPMRDPGTSAQEGLFPPLEVQN